MCNLLPDVARSNMSLTSKNRIGILPQYINPQSGSLFSTNALQATQLKIVPIPDIAWISRPMQPTFTGNAQPFNTRACQSLLRR